MASTKKTTKATATATETKAKAKRVPDERLYRARVSLYGIPNLDKRGVQAVAKYLRGVADTIENNPKSYSTRCVFKMMKNTK